jgi:hypothetical protein
MDASYVAEANGRRREEQLFNGNAVLKHKFFWHIETRRLYKSEKYLHGVYRIKKFVYFSGIVFYICWDYEDYSLH